MLIILLAKRWREHGDRDAAHKLVTSHLRLVTKIARDYRGYGLPISEAISEGNVGLMQAVVPDAQKDRDLETYGCTVDPKRDTNLRILLASRIYLDACHCDLKFAHPVTWIARADQYRSKRRDPTSAVRPPPACMSEGSPVPS